MTRNQFIQRRAFGQIAPNARVRTVIFKFESGIEWEEIFVDERYLTIEQQEDDFRAKMSSVKCITPAPEPGQPTPTVMAKNWKA
jgi:hypothetical protein